MVKQTGRFEQEKYHTVALLRNIFRNNIDKEITVARKTERDNETYKFACFLA